MDRLLKIFLIGISYITLCRFILQGVLTDGVFDLHRNPSQILDAMKLLFLVSNVYFVFLCIAFNHSVRKLSRHLSLDKITNSELLKKLIASKKTLHQQEVIINDTKKELSSLQTEIDEKDKCISDLNGKLALISEDDRDVSCENVTSRIEDSAMVKIFRELAKEHKTPSESRWGVFEGVFDTFFPEFRQILETNAKLSDADFRICALIWLNFSPSEIGVLMEMSKSNVSNRRRIAKKVFGEDMPVSMFDHKIRAISPTHQ